MGIESAPNFESDRIEKKEILREVQGQPFDPVCLRRQIGRIIENEVDLTQDMNALLELGCAIVDKVDTDKYVFGCQVDNCERVYNADFGLYMDVNAMRTASMSGVCFETAVAIGKRILPDPDDIF